MHVVNHWYLYRAFNCVEQEVLFERGGIVFNPNDEAFVKDIYQVSVAPWFAGLKANSKTLVKDTLAYCLQDASFNGEDILANLQDFDFPEPADSRSLFIWMWETLFPNENYGLRDTTDCVEVNDPMAINSL